MRKHIYKYSKRLLILFLGVPVVAIGIVLIPLPGPGLLVIIAGLAILSLEFDWARRWLDRARAELDKIVKKGKAEIEEQKDKLEDRFDRDKNKDEKK